MFHKQYDGPVPVFRKRFIDDFFGFATSDLEKYIPAYRSFNEAVQFTHEISSNSVNFLDLNFLIDNNCISTFSHYKPTYSYLRYDSHHPTKCKDSISYNSSDFRGYALMKIILLFKLRSWVAFLKIVVILLIPSHLPRKNFLTYIWRHDLLNYFKKIISTYAKNFSSVVSNIPLVLDFKQVNQKVKKNLEILKADKKILLILVIF